MPRTPSINPRIVEALYAEALALADELRQRFEMLRRDTADSAELERVQVSCEALRTTTRVMHCLAWLLNHRAHFAGDLSELQLRRHGRLIANFPDSDMQIVGLLPDDVRLMVRESERLYARIARLEMAWRGEPQARATAIERLRERLQERIADAG